MTSGNGDVVRVEDGAAVPRAPLRRVVDEVRGDLVGALSVVRRAMDEARAAIEAAARATAELAELEEEERRLARALGALDEAPATDPAPARRRRRADAGTVRPGSTRHLILEAMREAGRPVTLRELGNDVRLCRVPTSTLKTGVHRLGHLGLVRRATPAAPGREAAFVVDAVDRARGSAR